MGVLPSEDISSPRSSTPTANDWCFTSPHLNKNHALLRVEQQESQGLSFALTSL